MKIFLKRTELRAICFERANERGFVVIALLAVLTLMLIYAMATARVLNSLKQDIKLVEKKQIQRLEHAGAQPVLKPATTNAARPATP